MQLFATEWVDEFNHMLVVKLVAESPAVKGVCVLCAHGGVNAERERYRRWWHARGARASPPPFRSFPALLAAGNPSLSAAAWLWLSLLQGMAV